VATFPLSALNALRVPTVIPVDKRLACETGKPLSFITTKTGAEYLIFESVVGKGCVPGVHIIDLRSLKIVPELFNASEANAKLVEKFQIPGHNELLPKDKWQVNVISRRDGKKVFSEM